MRCRDAGADLISTLLFAWVGIAATLTLITLRGTAI